MIFPIQNMIRKMNTDEKKIYLTFDDGPVEFTLVVLDLLKKYKIQATFFVIGQNAEIQKKIMDRISFDGHSIFSHSIDHNYLNYFKSERNIFQWIKHSIEHLESLTKKKHSIFRPPAGITTPPLIRACVHHNIRIILWSQRFYDSIWPLSIRKITKYLDKAKAGDIILLHDDQSKGNQKIFLESLEHLITGLLRQGFQLKGLKF